MIYSLYIFICSLSQVLFCFFVFCFLNQKGLQSWPIQWISLPCPKAHFLPNTSYMSSLFVAVIVLRTPLLCSLCFLGGPLLKPLRTGSLCFSTYLFLFNPLCYYTLVLNICMELMLRGQVWLPPFCQTLDSSAQSRKLIPVWTVVTTQKRHSKQHRTQSRMV